MVWFLQKNFFHDVIVDSFDLFLCLWISGIAVCFINQTDLFFEETFAFTRTVFIIAVDAKISGNIILKQIILDVWNLVFADAQYHYSR